jgi:hypothetical protein
MSGQLKATFLPAMESEMQAQLMNAEQERQLAYWYRDRALRWAKDCDWARALAFYERSIALFGKIPPGVIDVGDDIDLCKTLRMGVLELIDPEPTGNAQAFRRRRLHRLREVEVLYCSAQTRRSPYVGQIAAMHFALCVSHGRLAEARNAFMSMVSTGLPVTDVDRRILNSA